jgi:hypothetical protein
VFTDKGQSRMAGKNFTSQQNKDLQGNVAARPDYLDYVDNVAARPDYMDYIDWDEDLEDDIYANKISQLHSSMYVLAGTIKVSICEKGEKRWGYYLKDIKEVMRKREDEKAGGWNYQPQQTGNIRVHPRSSVRGRAL